MIGESVGDWEKVFRRGNWDLGFEVERALEKKVGGIWVYAFSHVGSGFFYFLQITFFPSLLSAFKLDHIIPRGVKLKPVQIKLYNF